MSDSECKNEENVYSSTLNEFFWMWLASISPVLLAVLFLFIDGKGPSVNFVLKDIFLSGPIFAYVATLVAPFIFSAVQILKGKQKKKVDFAGTSILIAFVVAILSTGLFFKTQSLLIDKQKENVTRQQLLDIIPVDVINVAKVKLKNSIESNKVTDQSFSVVEILSFICYLLSLFIYIYSIYLNKKPPVDPNSETRKTTQNMTNVISKLTSTGK